MRINTPAPVAIYGTGIDIVEIERIKEAYLRHKERFLERIFTQKEREYCLSFYEPYPQLAVRFAAKEALAKALGTGIGKALSWQDIEVTKDALGKPLIHLHGEAKVRFNNPSFMLSMSHCRSYAIAHILWIAS